MDEHDIDYVDEKLKNEKSECRGEFMSQKNFYRSAVSAFLAILALLGGSFVWAMSISETTVTIKDGMQNNSRRIDGIEKMNVEQHRETMILLNDIKQKVSR